MASLIVMLFLAQVAPRNLNNILTSGGEAPIEDVEEEVKEKSLTEPKFIFWIHSFQLSHSFLDPSDLLPQTYQRPFLKPPRHA